MLLRLQSEMLMEIINQLPKLRFDILEQCEKSVAIPLVLHGGTGISPDDFVKCSKTGIKKINIATATFDTVEKTVHDCYNENSINGYYDLQVVEANGALRKCEAPYINFRLR